MTDFLQQVVAERRADIAAAKARVPERDLMAPVQRQVRLPGRDVSGARGGGVLLAEHRGDAFEIALRVGGPIAVIAEVKRRSPALGSFGEVLDVASIAKAYAAAGAVAISVLTEPNHWGGSIEDLVAVRGAVDIPVLCKDVIVDEYQLVQARAAGADAVLLIAEALDDALLRRLVERARSLGLGVLVEAHEAAAFGRAVATGVSVVGVNARNLRRPSEIDIGRVRQLHTFTRREQVLVAESGIESVNDVQLLPARVNAVLIGTALMRADDPAPLIHGIASIKRTVQA
jgi:indole-3-glycerol phosphate synthase